MTTLPPTVQEVGDHPRPNAVTHPTDRELKSRDEERKMRFYGVIQAFRLGKYPSNAQIEETLSYANSHSPIDESKLSPDGKQLVQDCRDILETFKLMIEKKNADELMQNFLYHTQIVDSEAHVQNLKEAGSAVPSKDEAKNDGQAAAHHLRTLAKLVYTSSETRKLLKDIGILARDVVADAAVNVAQAARPSEQDLAQVDEAAPSNEWAGPDGEKRTVDEKVPPTALEEKLQKVGDVSAVARDIASGAQSELQQAKSAVQSHGLDAASTVKSTAEAHDSDDVAAQAKAIQEKAKQMGREQKDKTSQTANEHKNRLLSVYNNLTGKIPEEHKQKGVQLKGDTANYLRDKFPEERRRRYIYRLKKVIVEQQRHRDYQEAVEFFLGLAESYQAYTTGVSSAAVDKGGEVWSDPEFKRARKELQTLLERFANGASMQPIFDAVNQIYRDSQKDPELKEWFHSLDKFLRRALQEPGFVLKDACDQAGRQINESGKKFWKDRYSSHCENLFDAIEKFFGNYAHDPLNIRFGQNWKNLTKDLFLNAEGSLTLKAHLWEDVSSVILPGLLKQVGYVPIPRIEYTDSQLDLVIENLTLEGQNILPNTVEIEVRNYFKLSAYSKIANANKHSFWISFSQIQADLRDVAFYVHKKTGFPKIKDSGLADVVISGNGVSGKIHVESSEAKDRVFIVKEVKAKVDRLAFGIRDTKHNFLYSTLRPLAQSLVKKQIVKAIEDGIRNGLTQLDSQLVDIKERLEEAEGDDKMSKMEVIKETFKSKKEESSIHVTEEKEKRGTFKIVANRDSQSVDWSSKDSILEKQAATQNLALGQGGEGWKSEAFTIIHAN